MEIIPLIIVSVMFLSAVVGYLWSVTWAIGDAQRRGRGGGLVVLFFLLFGPFAALVWLAVRPSQALIERVPSDYDDADGAIAAASRLDSLGDWDAALSLYRSVSERWPEHAPYVANCIADITQKQNAAAG